MRRPTPALLLALPVLLSGCLRDLWDDPIVYQALDYVVDEPMVVAVAARPPVFVSGEEVRLEALVLAPDGTVGTEGTLSVCGLDPEVWADLPGLDCYADEAEVEVIAEGDLPLYWTPPALTAECGETCSSRVPFMLETAWGGQRVQGGFNARVHPTLPDDAPERSLRTIPLGLSLAEDDDEPGIIEVTALLEAEGDEVVFRWYVDGGDLLGTGRTSAVYEEDLGFRSTNRWRVPETGGEPVRIVVVVGYDESWGLELSYPSTDTADTAAPPGAPDAPDMTWAVETWPPTVGEAP